MTQPNRLIIRADLDVLKDFIEHNCLQDEDPTAVLVERIVDMLLRMKERNQLRSSFAVEKIMVSVCCEQISLLMKPTFRVSLATTEKAIRFNV